MKNFSKFFNKRLTLEPPDEWSVDDSQFQVRAASKMIQITCSWLKDHFKTKLTARAGDNMSVADWNFHRKKCDGEKQGIS